MPHATPSRQGVDGEANTLELIPEEIIGNGQSAPLGKVAAVVRRAQGRSRATDRRGSARTQRVAHHANRARARPRRPREPAQDHAPSTDAPGSSLRDINDWTQGQILSSQRLIPQTAQLDSKALGGEFSLPMFVFQGAEDFTTPTSLAAEFVGSIRAPRKHFVSIAEGGHFAVFMKSDAFLNELVRHVLPLVPR